MKNIFGVVALQRSIVNYRGVCQLEVYEHSSLCKTYEV